MESEAPSRKTTNVPLERMNGGESSVQENSTDVSSTLTTEASTSDIFTNGGAKIVTRSGAGDSCHARNWSKTALFSGDESMFLSIVLSFGVEEASDTFKQAKWKIPHISTRLKNLALEIEAMELVNESKNEEAP